MPLSKFCNRLRCLVLRRMMSEIVHRVREKELLTTPRTLKRDTILFERDTKWLGYQYGIVCTGQLTLMTTFVSGMLGVILTEKPSSESEVDSLVKKMHGSTIARKFIVADRVTQVALCIGTFLFSVMYAANGLFVLSRTVGRITLLGSGREVVMETGQVFQRNLRNQKVAVSDISLAHRWTHGMKAVNLKLRGTTAHYTVDLRDCKLLNAELMKKCFSRKSWLNE